jgi:hypothetical protein
MTLLEYLDRIGERRLERARLHPPRPRDLRMLIGTLFFVGYYALVLTMMRGRAIPADNVTMVKDAMLVLGPVVGMIAQALFRTDVKDELAVQNTGLGYNAMRAQAEATKAAAEGTPPAIGDAVGKAADDVADAAAEEAAKYRNET